MPCDSPLQEVAFKPRLIPHNPPNRAAPSPSCAQGQAEFYAQMIGYRGAGETRVDLQNTLSAPEIMEDPPLEN